MFGSSLHEKVLCPFVWFLVVVVVDPQINWLSAVVCSFLCFCKGIHIFYRFGVLKTPRTWTTVLDLGSVAVLLSSAWCISGRRVTGTEEAWSGCRIFGFQISFKCSGIFVDGSH